MAGATMVVMMIILCLMMPGLNLAAASASSSSSSIIRQVTDDNLELLEHGHGLSGIPMHAIAHLLDSPQALFKRFMSLYHRSYSSSSEYAYRFRIFKHNLAQAARIQRLDPSAVHGITNFSDLTHLEFARFFLGLNAPAPFLKPSSSVSQAMLLPTDDLPSEFDWRDRGAVTEVKNQGFCGSCWAFSTTGALEGAHYVATGKLISLSEQQLVDCDHECDPEYGENACDSGCRGGLMTSAYSYIQKTGGLQLENDYPYRGFRGKCKFDASKAAAKIANFSTIVVDEDQIAANLVKNGPLAIGINAVFMQTYIGGVSCPYICSKQRLDHGVLLVGYGENGYSPIRLKEKPYWIIKNSWGPHWGEKGYYKICRGHNECGVDTMVSSVAAAIVH